MLLGSANMRALEMAAAEKMSVKNAKEDETTPLVPLDAKPRRKDATAE